MITIPDAMRRPAEVERDELREQLAEARAKIEEQAKLIESMKNCQNCGRGIGFCRHCKYAPEKRGWDDNWKEPI
jgi:heterodisulfide reductase subunit C